MMHMGAEHISKSYGLHEIILGGKKIIPADKLQIHCKMQQTKQCEFKKKPRPKSYSLEKSKTEGRVRPRERERERSRNE